MLSDAALYAESDDASGVTSSVMNGERAQIGTGAFDIIMPDSALPYDLKPRTTVSQLAKSKVRAVVAPEPTARSEKVEFVDQSLWTFKGGTAIVGAIDLPFADAPGEVAASDSASYAPGPSSIGRASVFVPSSPRMVI